MCLCLTAVRPLSPSKSASLPVIPIHGMLLRHHDWTRLTVTEHGLSADKLRLHLQSAAITGCVFELFRGLPCPDRIMRCNETLWTYSQPWSSRHTRITLWRKIVISRKQKTALHKSWVEKTAHTCTVYWHGTDYLEHNLKRSLLRWL